jgi:hypothetical protein
MKADRTASLDLSKLTLLFPVSTHIPKSEIHAQKYHRHVTRQGERSSCYMYLLRKPLYNFKPQFSFLTCKFQMLSTSMSPNPSSTVATHTS